MSSKEKRREYWQKKLRVDTPNERDEYLPTQENELNRKDFELKPNDLATMEKCPQCGALNVYRRYEHKETKELLPVWVGVCTRAVCSYYYSVNRYLRNEQKPNIVEPIESYLNDTDD